MQLAEPPPTVGSLLIRGGRVVDPSQSLDAVRDVLLRDGIVVELGEHLAAPDAAVFEAAETVVAPGFVDMHVHLREPGQTHKETIATGSAAGAPVVGLIETTLSFHSPSSPASAVMARCSPPPRSG